MAEILSGYLEVTDAVAEGLIDLQGEIDDVRDICGIIEILVDAATRIPQLQALSRDFLDPHPAAGARSRRAARRAGAADRWAREAAFLRRERLL